MPVAVPNVIGLGRTAAEAQLDALLLRHIAQFPFGATGDGSAAAQSPVGGTLVGVYSIVKVSYPTPFGPLDDSPVEGPTPRGPMDGQITSVFVGIDGASVDFVTDIDGDSVSFNAVLYADPPAQDLPRPEWMRRGAMLGLAQRAFTNAHRVRLSMTTYGLNVQSIGIFKP